MVQDTMGNLVTVEGDNAKEIVKSLLTSVPDSNKEILLDFSKIVDIDDKTNEQECKDKWGVDRNASDCSVIFEGDYTELGTGNHIFFNTHDKCNKIIRLLSEKYPELTIQHDYCNDQAEVSGYAVYERGLKIAGGDYEPLSAEAVWNFHTMWGRENEFILDKETKKYVRAEAEM